jgi:hypothetical protein
MNNDQNYSDLAIRPNAVSRCGHPQRFLSVVLLAVWALLALPAELFALQAACNIRNDVDFTLNSEVANTPLNVSRLYEAARRIGLSANDPQRYELILEHQQPIINLLTRFANYLGNPQSGSTIDVYSAYTDAVLTILDSPGHSTGTPEGQKAMRTVNQIGRLFSVMPDNVLDISIGGEVWRQATYATASQAFSRNALRVQLLAARNSDTLGAMDTVALAGAVRWNSPTDVVFSGYYTNHPGVSGTAKLPPQPSFWSWAPSSPRFSIDNAAQYTDWLSNHFYQNGAMQIEPSTGAPIGLTLTDGLSQPMRERLQSNVVGTYNNQDTGLPGTHAEIQAANALATGLSSANTLNPRISVHTVRTTRQPECAGFECCAGCTTLLQGWARSTGGGGTLRDPFRRR